MKFSDILQSWPPSLLVTNFRLNWQLLLPLLICSSCESTLHLSIPTEMEVSMTNELGNVLKQSGEHVNEADLPNLVAELDTDRNGTICFLEFASCIHSLRSGESKGESIVGKAMRRTTGLLKVEGAGGATHMFSDEEKIAFSEHVNQCLRGDPVVARHLPLDVNSYQLFERAGDGLIFWYVH